jgi:glycosyltransferase involved in cell wall biosynthesis
LAVGRLAPVKGFDVLIEAWANVKGARLQIAGDGPDRGSLESLIREHNLQDRVLLLGQRNDILDLLAQSDLMVISSRREGMPLVLAEALQAGCPVVSTAVGGMVGFLPESVLTRSEDPKALAERINEALSDLPEYSERLEPLYRFARTEMTVETMARKTADVYQQVIRNY